MDTLYDNYYKKVNTYSDIYEHMPTLYRYAKECESVVECGVRSVVSSWAFLKGLYENGKENKMLVSVDLERSQNVDLLEDTANKLNINFQFIEGNDIYVDLPKADIYFIDTWHVYGHMKRELNKFKNSVNKYIIMHDTTVDEIYGETIREKMDAAKQAKESGYPLEEILRGIWPAVEEFLKENPNFKLKERFTNNNGLTVLEKIA